MYTLSLSSILLSLCPSLAKLVASYPGRLSPVFVACSTKVGESLVKLITCSDVPAWALGGCVDEWQHSFCTTGVEWISELERRCKDYLIICFSVISGCDQQHHHFQECATPAHVPPASSTSLQ